MTFTASIPSYALYTWDSQACQYPTFGEPGISYFAGVTDLGTVDCLLYRNERGVVVGILNYYDFDSPWEVRGNVNVWVRRNAQGRGIGTALIEEAHRRWTIDLDQQRFTPEGAAFAERLRERGTL
jgi:GNAT superfamily N-acetyltransferase